MEYSITRRQFLGSTAGLGCVLATSASHAFAESPPNIILLMGDDHGWDETGYNGHPHLKTPVLDEMASTGLRLDRFYAAAPVCSPTRARGSMACRLSPAMWAVIWPLDCRRLIFRLTATRPSCWWIWAPIRKCFCVTGGA